MSQTINLLPEKIKKVTRVSTKEEVFALRLEGKKFVLIKSGGKLYVVFVNKSDAGLIRIAVGKHKCNHCANFYNHKTGRLCPKIADCPEDIARNYTYSAIEAIKESKRVEKYDFIAEGAECVNFDRGYFLVGECSNFRPNDRGEERMNEKERSREWFDRQRELTEELKEQKPMQREVLCRFGYNPR